MGTVNVPILASGDDGTWAYPSTFENAGTTVPMGRTWPGAYPSNVFLRFADVHVHRDATISAAYVTLVPAVTKGDAWKTNLYGVDEGNYVAPTSYAEADTDWGLMTTATVLWTIGTTTEGVAKNTDDITAIVQEIVSRGDWLYGNALGIMASMGGAAGYTIAEFASFDHSTYAGAILHIEFTDPDPPNAPTLTAPNGGESWREGESQNLTYTPADPEHPTGLPCTYEYEFSAAGDFTDAVLVDSGIAASPHSWLLPATLIAADTATCKMRVRARVTDDLTSAWDASDAAFTVIQSTAPVATLVTPLDAGLLSGIPPTLVFGTADTEGDNIHVELEIASDAGYVNLYGSTDSVTDFTNWQEEILTPSLRRITSGLLARDEFSSDTSANYDTLAGTIAMSGGVATLSAASARVIYTPAGKAAGCVTVRGLRSGNRATGSFLNVNGSLDASGDVDGYLVLLATSWLLQRLTDNGANSLGSTASGVPADGAYGLSRLILTAAGAIARVGTTALSVQIDSTDTTYPAPLYGGLVGGAQVNQQADWLEARTAHTVVCTGLPAGAYLKVSDGVTTAKAAASAGTATVDAGAVLFPLASVSVYDGDPDAGGVLLATLTSADLADMGGGDTFEVVWTPSWTAVGSGGATAGNRIRYQCVAWPIPFGTMYGRVKLKDTYSTAAWLNFSFTLTLDSTENLVVCIDGIGYQVTGCKVTENTNGDPSPIELEIDIDQYLEHLPDEGDLISITTALGGGGKVWNGTVEFCENNEAKVKVYGVQFDAYLSRKTAEGDEALADLGANFKSFVTAWGSPLTGTAIDVTTGVSAALVGDYLYLAQHLQEILTALPTYLAWVDPGKDVHFVDSSAFGAATYQVFEYDPAGTAIPAGGTTDQFPMLAGSTVKRSILESANRVLVRVKGTAIVGEAINTTVHPTYAESPRVMVITIDSGDLAYANAVAAAQLALHMLTRVYLSNVPVHVEDGLWIERGQNLQVVRPAFRVDVTAAVRRIEHDLVACVSLIDIGDFWSVRDDEDVVVTLANKVDKLEKRAV